MSCFQRCLLRWLPWWIVGIIGAVIITLTSPWMIWLTFAWALITAGGTIWWCWHSCNRR